jgi:hypothetical protein
VFAPFPEVRAEAERLAVERGISINCLPDQVPHDKILRLHGSACASIAISIADGISTSLRCDELLSDSNFDGLRRRTDRGRYKEGVRLLV